MNQITLAQARPALTQVSGMTGMSVTDTRFIERLNLAQQELMFEGDFPGVVDRWLFRADQATGIVALPYIFDRLMQITVDGIPDTIVSPWFEFYGYGPGIQDDYDARGNLRYSWTRDVFDRGDSPVVTQIPDFNDSRQGPWVLRVYATVDEDVDGDAPEINIQGLDPDGLIIRTLDGSYYNGLNVPINFGVPYTQTTQEFSKITGIVKPETNGYVRLTAWNGSVEVELSNFAFNETAPSYRHYFVPRMHNLGYSGERQRIILARCRKRFVPVAADNDLLIITNINALKSMIVAQWKRDAGEYEAYMLQKQTAVDILRKEATGYLGKTKIPALTMQRGFSIGATQYIR